MKILDRANKLMLNVFLDSVEEYPTFTLTNSYFNDYWYDFLIPKVPFVAFDWKAFKKQMEDDKEAGLNRSVYIPHSLDLNEYSKKIIDSGYKKEGDDCYLVLNTSEELPKKSNFSIQSVNEENLDEFLDLAEEVFFKEEGWETARSFSQRLFDLSKDFSIPQKTIQSYLVYKGNTPVGFGSIVIDIDVNLGYLCNSGVKKEFRRQGIHSLLVAERINLGLEKGVTEFLSITGFDSNSSKSLAKLGFKQHAAHDIFY